jgi:hypothetical protein
VAGRLVEGVMDRLPADVRRQFAQTRTDSEALNPQARARKRMVATVSLAWACGALVVVATNAWGAPPTPAISPVDSSRQDRGLSYCASCVKTGVAGSGGDSRHQALTSSQFPSTPGVEIALFGGCGYPAANKSTRRGNPRSALNHPCR